MSNNSTGYNGFSGLNDEFPDWSKGESTGKRLVPGLEDPDLDLDLDRSLFFEDALAKDPLFSTTKTRSNEDKCFVAENGRISGCTVTGPRSNNEDCIDYATVNGYYVLAIADGVGGAPYSEVASKIGTSIFVKTAKALLADKTHPHEAIVRAVHEANRSVRNVIQALPETHGEMCCTFIGAIVKGQLAYLVHLGDSRAYVVSRTNKDMPISQITTDHSLFEQRKAEALARKQESIMGWKDIDAVDDFEVVDAPGVLDAYMGAWGGLLCRVLGDSIIQPDYFVVPLEKEDVLLLCTDGVSNAISTAEIGDAVLKAGVLDGIAGDLVSAIGRKRYVDNTTALALCASPVVRVVPEAVPEAEPEEGPEKPAKTIPKGKLAKAQSAYKNMSKNSRPKPKSNK